VVVRPSAFRWVCERLVAPLEEDVNHAVFGFDEHINMAGRRTAVREPPQEAVVVVLCRAPHLPPTWPLAQK
jgi:hypothetical protein